MRGVLRAIGWFVKDAVKRFARWRGAGQEVLAPEIEPAPRTTKSNLGFWLIVVVPTLCAGIYYFLIASDLYMSEVRFLVRSPSQSTPVSLGAILQSAGAPKSDSSSAVLSFIESRQAVEELDAAKQLRGVFGRPEGDFISRFPSPWSDDSFEALYKHYSSFVSVWVDSETGVTTLQVKAYRAADARAVAQSLLLASERLVNEMNRRAETDAVRFAVREVEEAQAHLRETQAEMTAYRLGQQILDPQLSATTLYGTIGSLTSSRAAAAVRLDELQRTAPKSPSIPTLKTRLAALDRQIGGAKQGVTGGSGSVVSKLGEFQRLTIEADLASKMVGLANQDLVAARQDAQRQHIYLEHIAGPNLPDKALYPKRLFTFGMVFAASLIIYGILWLLMSGIREHTSD